MFNNSTDHKMEKVTSETIIGPSVSVEGTIDSAADIVIYGSFKGTLKVGRKVTIGKEATIEADIETEHAYIAGHVKGNIIARNKLELSHTAKVDGDIEAGILTMESGAILNGGCKMSASGPENAHKDGKDK